MNHRTEREIHISSREKAKMRPQWSRSNCDALKDKKYHCFNQNIDITK